MSITASIRKKPWLLLGMIFIALLAFLVNPDSMDKMFGKDPNILGKVNGEEITRDEFNDQLGLLQQQSQGRPQQGLEEQAWQTLVQSKLIKQQFEKMGLKLPMRFSGANFSSIQCFLYKVLLKIMMRKETLR